MKRFFPLAVREAIGFPSGLSGLLGLLVLSGASCAPDQGVKPGAPAIASLSIVEPSGNRVDVTAAANECVGLQKVVPDGGAAGTSGAAGAGGAGGTADAGTSDAGSASDAGSSDAGTSDAGSAGDAGTASDAGTTMPSTVMEGDDCDPDVDGVCTLAGNACQCVAKDMCDQSIDPANPTTKGTLNCTFAALSTVVATFDRLLDTTPFTSTDGTPINTVVGTISTAPAAGKVLTLDGEYRSDGSSSGLVFTMFFGRNGPTITYHPGPGFPTSSTVTTTLDGAVARAKDGKTAFVATGAIAEGTLHFKTAPISPATITVPAPPAPMDNSGGGSMMMGCPMPMTTPDGGSDAAADGGAGDGASTPDGNADGGAGDAPASDAAASDAGASDAAASDAAASDAAAGEVEPSTDVPADMNKAAITIAFSSVVGKDILSHITITEDGQPFTDFVAPADTDFPLSTVSITPKTTWAAGKKYEITLDADAADAFGVKFGDAQTVSFTMSKS